MGRGLWVGAVGSDAGEREGQRGKERPQEKKKRKRMTKLPRPLKFPVARSQMHPLGEKMKTENAPKLSTHRENTKDNFSILFFFIGWFGSFPWAGGPPASDPLNP